MAYSRNIIKLSKVGHDTPMVTGVLSVLLLAGAAEPATLAAYKAKCQQCHMASGNSPLEPLNFADGKWKHGGTVAAIARVIRNGVDGSAMKPFKDQLTTAEIDALAEYVRAFAPPPKARKAAAPKP
jgi:mono/diheme cytochrome c family protein